MPKKPPLQLMLWTNSGTESTVGLAPRRDNHDPRMGICDTQGHCHFNPNKAHWSKISYIIVIHFDFI